MASKGKVVNELSSVQWLIDLALGTVDAKQVPRISHLVANRRLQVSGFRE